MIILKLESAREQFAVRVALIKYRAWLKKNIEVIETFVDDDLKPSALEAKQSHLEIVEKLLSQFRRNSSLASAEPAELERPAELLDEA